MSTLKTKILEMVVDKRISKNVAKDLLTCISDENYVDDQIAIIGASVRLGNIYSLEDFWKFLKNEDSLICSYPENRREDSKTILKNRYGKTNEHISQEIEKETFYANCGYLSEIDQFDAEFFNISKEEADYMDPYQRILLETTWRAFENASYSMEKLNGTDTGVYIGRDHSYETYYETLVGKQNIKGLEGTWPAVLAGRVSYIFNLKGPSEVIDTACSSSLVAVHNACNALRNRECSMAVAGGIAVNMGRPQTETGMSKVESTNSEIRVFGDNANGTVWGEGAGIVVLKPLRQAIEDKDTILSVILASGVNCDGNSGEISTPNAQAQKELLINTWKRSKIMPETISYIETHGTGTRIGDPIEVKAIDSAFSKFTKAKQFCALGSIKPNVGHLVSASGIISLIKVILSMQKRQLPATINISNVNTMINFVDSSVYICDQLREWVPNGDKLRAGVSCFGFSGTNSHILLEEPPKQTEKAHNEMSKTYLFPVSAKTQEGLEEYIARYITCLEEKEYDFTELCYTASVWKDHFKYRLVVIADSQDDLLNKLRNYKCNHRADYVYYGEASNQYKDIVMDVQEKELQNICKLYVKGGTIQWYSFYQGLDLRRVRLPIYPLNRIRHWYGNASDKIEDVTEKKDGMEEEYELSNAQERMWILQELTPGLTAYNLPMIIHYESGLNLEALEYTLNYLIKRHDAFRTRIIEHEGVARQVVQPFEPYKIEMIDLSNEEKPDKTLDQVIKSNNQHVFDLSKETFCAKLYKLGENSYSMYILLHHIISDAWSQNIISREFSIVYQAYEEKKEIKLPEITQNYVKWVANQKQWLLTEKCKQMEQYWCNEMSEPLPQLNLPMDKQRPREKTYQGGYVDHEMRGAERLKEIAAQNGVSMQILLLALYNVLLYKLTNQDDVIVGIPLAERIEKSTENVIGLFVNTICVRTKIQNESTFHDILEQVSEKSIQAYSNGKYPFDLLISKVNPERSLSGEALFSVFFEYNDLFPPENGSSLFDLYLLCKTQDDRLQYKLNYNKDIFNEETIKRFAGFYENIVKAVLENGTKVKLSQMDLMDESAKREVICEFNCTEYSYDKEQTLDQIFEEKAAKMPDKEAVLFGDMSYTYRQVNERANQLANQLRKNGVTSDSIVAVMMKKSADMIVTILAILKAGAAYLPIDITFPEERIRYILEDSQTKWIVMQKEFEHAVAFDGTKYLIEDETLFKGEYDNLERIHNSRNLAYVIYTSGTTGLPKGVLVEHQSAVNRLIWMLNEYPVTSDAVFLQKTPYTFDVSVWEIFLWFFAEASVYVIHQGEEKNPQALVDIISSKKITIMHFVPSMLYAFLQYVEVCKLKEQLSSLQYVIVSGEALQVNHVELFRTLFEGTKTQLHNLYGPTEATVDVTYYDCRKYNNGRSVPIGTPISNVQIYILDQNNNILPVGVPGELCIAGDALARGYINKPELTSEKFQVNPFTSMQNPFREESRIYHTGDLARWLEDGTIEYLGRIDSQVKIHGYRIELDDIQRNLLKHEGITEAAVVVKEKKQDHYLCAYYVGEQLKSAEIKDFLTKYLPDYMIPVKYVHIDKMPLSKNGKADVKYLRNLADVEQEENHGISMPYNKVQEEIVDIWAELLEIDKKKIGIRDRFFDLGGNSILLLHMHRLLVKTFDIKMSVAELFSINTIEKIAETILKKEAADNTSKSDAKQKPLDSTDAEIEFHLNKLTRERLEKAEALSGYRKDSVLLSGFLALHAQLSGKTDILVKLLRIQGNKQQCEQVVDLSNIDGLKAFTELADTLESSRDEYQLYLEPMTLKEQGATVCILYEKNCDDRYSREVTLEKQVNLVFSCSLSDDAVKFRVKYKKAELSDSLIKTISKRYMNIVASMVKNIERI